MKEIFAVGMNIVLVCDGFALRLTPQDGGLPMFNLEVGIRELFE